MVPARAWSAPWRSRLPLLVPLLLLMPLPLLMPPMLLLPPTPPLPPTLLLPLPLLLRPTLLLSPTVTCGWRATPSTGFGDEAPADGGGAAGALELHGEDALIVGGSAAARRIFSRRTRPTPGC